MKSVLLFFTLSITLSLASPIRAETLTVAIASNFKHTAKKLIDQFEQHSGHEVVSSFASTGKLFTQIKQRAPFDIFLAADELRPSLLEQQGYGIPHSRFTYAQGKLVLWSPQSSLLSQQEKILYTENYHYLAIANPKHAPYGKAAQQALNQMGLWNKVQHKLVRGENINQAYHYVQSGSAELGLLAYSQILRQAESSSQQKPQKKLFWLVPQKYYEPITQQAILLKDKKAAKSFLSFLQSEEALALIRQAGYDTP